MESPSEQSVESVECDSGASIGVARAIALGVLFYVIYFVTFAGVRLAGAEPMSAPSLLITQILPWLVVIAVAARLSSGGYRAGVSFVSVPIRLWPSLVVASIGSAIIFPQIAGLIPMPDAITEYLRELGAAGPLPLALSLGVIAPLAEEVFFRGLLLREFLARYSTTKAIWASAIYFAVFHLNPWQGVIALPVGVAYAWLVIRTGSLWPSIASHAIVNSFHNFATPGLLRLWGLSELEIEKVEVLPIPLLLVGAVALVGGTLWILNMLRVERESREPFRDEFE